MDYVYLSGSEDVQRAASSIRESADVMRRAADDITLAVERLIQHSHEFQHWADSRQER